LIISQRPEPSRASRSPVGFVATLSDVTLNPLATLKRSLARKARLPEIHGRLDNQHNRLLGLRHQIEDMTKNLEHLVSVSDAQLRTQLSSVAKSAVGLQESLNEMQRNLDAGLSNAENRLTSLNESLVAHVEKFREIDRTWAAGELAQLRRGLDNIRRSLEELGPREAPTPESTPSASMGSALLTPSAISDLDYLDLEDAFRGSRDTISQRQSVYLPIVQAVDSDKPVLDLGCGRGEWLDLLAAGGVRAIGLDTNTSCVKECKDRGLNVEHAELIDYLSKAPEYSLRAITAFQVFEHLSFRDLREVMRLSQRALVPGGVLVAEVPNAKNARVASGTFWIDPTHVRPWYPDLLEHLSKDAGFTTVEGRYVNPLLEQPELVSLDEESRKALRAVFEALFGPADYALIAHA